MVKKKFENNCIIYYDGDLLFGGVWDKIVDLGLMVQKDFRFFFCKYKSMGGGQSRKGRG